MSEPPKPEDWLPHDPPPQPPQSNSSLRTLGLWAVLVIMFVALYAMFTNDDPYPRAVEPVRVGYSGWWIAGGIVGTLLLVLAMFAWLFGNTTKFNTAQAEGLQSIADGKYHDAAALFEHLARRYRAKPNFAAVARYNHGYALLRAGDTAAAVGILLGGDRIPKVGIGVRKLTAIQLARCFALAGDLDRANAWLDAARKRGSGMADPVHDRALLESVEGLVLCRAGKLDEAARHYDQAWARFRTYLPIEQMIEVWLMRAYAASGGTAPRDAAAGEPWLRMLRGASPRSLDWLTARWPELQTFVVTHELGARHAA